MPAFLAALPKCRCPVWYNGDIFSLEDMDKLQAADGLAGVMLGRGAVADPALPRLLRGGNALTAGELKAFHDALLGRFLAEGLQEQAAMARLKELWFYMLYKFPDSKKEAKALLKAQRLAITPRRWRPSLPAGSSTPAASSGNEEEEGTFYAAFFRL